MFPDVMDLLYSQLMVEYLSNGPFSITTGKKCEFIRLLASSCNEFENDVSNGAHDLTAQSTQRIDGFDHQINQHASPELNSMTDYLMEFPELCWFNICQYLSIKDIAQLSSTCRVLRHMLWSRQSSLWIYLIGLKFHSSILCQSLKVFFYEDKDQIINEIDRFCKRLLSDTESYKVLHESFLQPGSCQSWHAYFLLPEKDTRGCIAMRRFIFPNPIRLSDYPVALSSKLFRLFYYRLNKTSISAPIGALIYGYLIDPRRCLSIANMCYRNNTMSKDEKRSVKIPLWCDLPPGRYNLTCQMRLRGQLVGNSPDDDYLLGKVPIDICLLGDRADHGGRWNTVRYSWLIKQHEKYDDDQWFNVSLIENFLLNDISNVYFGIRVENDYPVLFDVSLKNIQLNFIAIN